MSKYSSLFPAVISLVCVQGQSGYAQQPKLFQRPSIDEVARKVAMQTRENIPISPLFKAYERKDSDTLKKVKANIMPASFLQKFKRNTFNVLQSELPDSDNDDIFSSSTVNLADNDISGQSTTGTETHSAFGNLLADAEKSGAPDTDPLSLHLKAIESELSNENGSHTSTDFDYHDYDSALSTSDASSSFKSDSDHDHASSSSEFSSHSDNDSDNHTSSISDLLRSSSVDSSTNIKFDNDYSSSLSDFHSVQSNPESDTSTGIISTSVDDPLISGAADTDGMISIPLDSQLQLKKKASLLQKRSLVDY